MGEVRIPAGDGDVPAYVATPAVPGPWPGVVVLHDAMGMSPDLRRQADWLAGEGYLAAAPDLFHWGGTLRCMRSIVAEVLRGEGRTYRDIEAVRQWLAGQEGCTGRIGVVGFCMGGGLSLMLATRGDYDASSVNYGTTRKRFLTPEALRGACPLVGSYGTSDVVTRRSARRLEESLTVLGTDHDIRMYPGVGHGFMNDHDAKGASAVLAKVTHTAYDEEATRDARRRIVAFFDRHLKAPAG